MLSRPVIRVEEVPEALAPSQGLPKVLVPDSPVHIEFLGDSKKRLKEYFYPLDRCRIGWY
jgi:hypothetical protein